MQVVLRLALSVAILNQTMCEVFLNTNEYNNMFNLTESHAIKITFKSAKKTMGSIPLAPCCLFPLLMRAGSDRKSDEGAA